MIKFYYNGIKGSDNKLQKVTYSDSTCINYPVGTITIYGKSYNRFSTEVRNAFTVENNTDSQTDYFENDKIRVVPGNKYYAEIKRVMEVRKAKHEANYSKRAA